MLHVNNTYQTQYNMTFASNPVQNCAEEGAKAPE